MTVYLFLKCIGCGFFGILIQLGFEMLALKKQAKAANMQFSVVDAIKMDWLNIGMSVVAVIAFTIGFDELVKLRPFIMEIVKWFFMFIGGAGSSILFSLFGQAKKQILSVIDKKTNIADGVE